MLKRFSTLALGLLVAAGVSLASAETVYLKNGSIIRGQIVEQVPGTSITVLTSDGSRFVYSESEVARITNEPSSPAALNSGNCRHRRLDFAINTGYNIGTKGGTGYVPIDLSLSKRFSPNFSLGIGAGMLIPTGGGDPIIPIFATAKGFFPLKSTKITPFVEVRGGYAINTADDETVGSGKYRVTVEAHNYVQFSIMPGIRIPMSHRTDLDFGVGYEHFVPSGGGDGFGAVMFKLGLNFHATTNPNHVKTVNPVYDSGFELGFDFTGMDWGADMVLGYKLSPKLSFGLGIGYSACSKSIPGGTIIRYTQENAQGEAVEENFDGDNEILESLKIFLRAQYRFTDRKFSPIVAVDLGYRNNRGDYINEYMGNASMAMGGARTAFFDLYDENNDDIYKASSTGGFFVRPMIGMSMRIGSNSYLEAKVGAEITGGVGKYDEIRDAISDIGYTRYRSMQCKMDGKNFSGFAFSIGWKHTFSLFSRH